MSLTSPERASIHANELLFGETGVWIRGPSGSGKSALTLDMIALATLLGDFASLIADDQVLLERRNGRLLARPHPRIAGMIEARGMGVLDRQFEPCGVIHALVALTTADRLARVPEDAAETTTLLDVSLPTGRVASENARATTLIIEFIQSVRQI